MCLSAASARQRRDYTFQITDKWEIIAETEILQVKSRRSRDSAQIEARYTLENVTQSSINLAEKHVLKIKHSHLILHNRLKCFVFFLGNVNDVNYSTLNRRRCKIMTELEVFFTVTLVTFAPLKPQMEEL